MKSRVREQAVGVPPGGGVQLVRVRREATGKRGCGRGYSVQRYEAGQGGVLELRARVGGQRQVELVRFVELAVRETSSSSSSTNSSFPSSQEGNCASQHKICRKSEFDWYCGSYL